MGTSVRIAGPDDVVALAGLRRAWNAEKGTGDDDTFVARFASWWEAERTTRTFFLIEVDGRPVGMANVKHYIRMPVVARPDAGRWGYVGNVFVLAEHRNAGTGRVLMEAVVAWAGAEGLGHLRLAPSPLSRTFYARLGFTPGAVVELDPPPGAPPPAP